MVYACPIINLTLLLNAFQYISTLFISTFPRYTYGSV